MSKFRLFQGYSNFIGQLEFFATPRALTPCRHQDGCLLSLPAKLTLDATPETEPFVQIEKMECRISILQPGVGDVIVGQACHDEPILSSKRAVTGREVLFSWHLRPSEAATIERLRDGGPLDLKFDLFHYSRSMFPLSGATDAFGIGELRRHFESNRVTVPLDRWQEALQQADLAELLVYEVAIPKLDTNEWHPVHRDILKARNALRQGGTTGWQSCVTFVRQALEAWDKIAGEEWNQGTTGRRIQDVTPKDRTKNERIRMLRRALHEFCHISAHSSDEFWSRDDAVLALTSLVALLRERNP
jgi:hypothetical protein